jgi:hypothetical protein
MMASPLRVSSVFVGETGDCAPFSISLMIVSPVMVREGAIAGQGLGAEGDQRTDTPTLVGKKERANHTRDF